MSKKSERRERARLRHLQRAGLIKGEEKKDTSPEAARERHAEKRSKNKAVLFLKDIYWNKYKALFIITIALFVLAVAQIGYQTATTGDFINKGVSLKGGVTITIPNVDYDPAELRGYMEAAFPGRDISVRVLTGAGNEKKSLTIDADITDNEEVERFKSEISGKLGITKDEYTTNFIGSSLGENFFRQIIISLIIAFIAMAIVVLIYFRSLAPSMIVILCALCDILETLAVVNLLGMKLSTAGIAAFLMLIGYSVDTDILLTTRLLKRKEETIEQNIYSSAKTGLTMTITSIAAVIVALLLSRSADLSQIMTILLIGLILDILNTWIQNMGILRWYIEIKEKKESKDVQG